MRPVFSIQYNEKSLPIEKPVVMPCMPFVIDGLFNTARLTRFSLGSCVNPDRSDESRTCLAQIGLGLEFSMGSSQASDESIFYVKSSTINQTAYIFLKASKQQIVLMSGETKAIFDMGKLSTAKVVPKKLAKLYDEYSFKVSFGKPFSNDENNNQDTLCWLQINLMRLAD